MSRSRTAPFYLNKQQIRDLDSRLLLDSFETAVGTVTNRLNNSAGVPVRLYSELRTMRKEILSRMGVTEVDGHEAERD